MTFRPTPNGEAELRKLILPELRKIAAGIVERAEANAPDGDRRRGNADTYRYRIERGTIIVGSTDPNAHIIEFGSATSPEYAPLRRAIRAAELELSDPGRSGGRTGRIRGARRVRRQRRG